MSSEAEDIVTGTATTMEDPSNSRNTNSHEKVSVILLNAFSIEDLKACLESLVTTKYPNYEIIIVDYATPGISEFIKVNYPSFKLVVLEGNDIGPSAMHNVGIMHSDILSKYVAFLDVDTIVDKDWLNELVKSIEKSPKIAAVQAKLLLYAEPSVLNSKGNMANYLAVGWPEGFREQDESLCDTKEISFASGAATLMRKDALENIGSYDDTYFIYVDDLDVGLRLRLAGYTIVCCTKSVVYHKYTFLRSKRSFYYLNRNRQRTFLKLYSLKTYLLMIPAIFLYESSVIVFAIRNGFTNELFKAYLQNLKDFRKILSKRKEVHKFKTISDKALILSLKGAINFSEISDQLAVKYLLNPFLEKNKRILIDKL